MFVNLYHRDMKKWALSTIENERSVPFRFESDDPFFTEEEPMKPFEIFKETCVDDMRKLSTRDKQVLFSSIINGDQTLRTRQQVASELGITRQAVSKRIRYISEQSPALGRLLGFGMHHATRNWVGKEGKKIKNISL